MASNYRNPKRKKEFWEPQDYAGYLGAGTPPGRDAPAPYETPGLDVQALQEQAMYLPTKAYEKGVASLGSRMAKRKMGRSGAYVEGELDEMQKYLLDMPRGDIALRAEELAQKERLGMRELGLREEELALKKFLGTEELGLEKERLSMQDRQFESQLELEWQELGLNEREINDRKEMFYAEQGRLSDQFNRDYTLRETEAAWRHQEELGRQHMTQQQIDNEMVQFDQQLSWEKEHYGMVLSEEQRQFNDTLAFQLQQLAQTGEIEFGKLNETIRQFDGEMTRLLDLDKFEMTMQERGMDLEDFKVRKQVEIEEAKNTMMNNEIFGYWEPGFGPGEPNHFTGEKYVWDEKIENWVTTPEYDLFMTEHYNKGALDLREWEIQIEGMLGMRGMIPGDEEGEAQLPPTVEEIRKNIKDAKNQVSTLRAELRALGEENPEMWSATEYGRQREIERLLKDLKAQIKSWEDDEQALIDDALANYNPGGG